MVNFGPLESLAEAVELEFRDVEPVGRDLRLVARMPGRDSF
jgi:diaminohydroxyphosphoribosylaminopyrimidine deaminase/5-amino-6-(5-phosphoribosylamino)uracil reductase